MCSGKISRRIVGGVLFGLVWVILSMELSAHELRYEGRTFTEWSEDLQDLSSRVRLKAVEALAHFGPRAVPVLSLALKDPDRDVRLIAVAALSALAPVAKAAVPVLIKTLTDPDQVVRRRAAEALDKMELMPKEVVPGLIQVFKDSDRDARLNMIEALIESKMEPIAVSALI